MQYRYLQQEEKHEREQSKKQRATESANETELHENAKDGRVGERDITNDLPTPAPWQFAMMLLRTLPSMFS